MSRLLVLMTTLLLLVMPVTEHLCNWDNFLRGGPDVEFSVLAWLLFAAMVVLSMNGTMLRPAVMQSGMPVPISRAVSQGASAASGSLSRSITSRCFGRTRSRYRWLDEPGPPTDAGLGSRIPMRI